VTFDRLWARVKESSQRYAAQNRHLNVAEAKQIVRALCESERISELSQEAIEFFALELMRLTDEREGRST
jgi:hypothetical protein